MKIFLIALILLCLAMQALPQVVVCDPPMPVDDQSVVVTFYADRGNKGLMNYTGDDVYAHTGVITDKSSNWRYVKATWTTNLPSCKLTKVSANVYTLTITPDIRQFYGVPAGEKILKMAFVFRNANGSKTGRDVGGADIFTSVYEKGLQVSFNSPAERVSMVPEGDSLTVSVNSNNADSLWLFMDDLLITKTTSNSIDTSITATDKKLHRLICRAKNATASSADTAWFIIQGTPLEVMLPENYKDGISYPASDSALFVLYAPGKSAVYVCGDFNDWLPDSSYLMKKDGDRFWLKIGNLTAGQEYAFQYVIDGNIHVTDPYTEKILDPDFDKYIPASVYPGLKAYPLGKANGIVGVITPGKQAYDWGEESYAVPDNKDLVIYELLIRDFVSTHDIKGVQAKLDYLETLGVNAIELMPFSEFEADTSWGYNPSFYFAPDKFYGRDTDYKDFIKECHSRGMVVIMDMVLNHSYGQSPMVKMYFNNTTGKVTADNPWYNVDSPNPSYSWGYDFNHQSPATRYFVNRVTEYWLNEYHLDGFRFDFTKGFTNVPGDGSGYDTSRITILKRIYDHIKQVKPSAYMICEHFAPNAEEKILSDYGMLLWGNINHNYNEATMGYLEGSDLAWASYKEREWDNPNLVAYMESHDEERLMYKNIKYGNSNGIYNIKYLPTALKRQELAGAFFFTIPGPKMIWQFGELGYDVSIDYHGRVGVKPVKWEYYDNEARKHLYLVWAKLIDLRKKYPVFSTDDYTLDVGSNVALKKITLRNAEEDAIVIGNFGMTSGIIQPAYTSTGWWYELFSGDSINVTDVNATVTLNAGEYRIYASKKLKSVITGTDNPVVQDIIGVYPNPATNWLYVKNSTVASAEIYDISGTVLRRYEAFYPASPLDISMLPQGLYLIRIYEGHQVKTAKFVKE